MIYAGWLFSDETVKVGRSLSKIFTAVERQIIHKVHASDPNPFNNLSDGNNEPRIKIQDRFLVYYS